MQKARKYDWKDSNMALFGSDTEKKVKKESAESEPAWENAGSVPGLKIWRINKFKVEAWPEDQYGEFYNGDSYIILNTYKKDGEEELEHDVHFWIGKYSTQDEYGTAAYKTVELDTFLDDKPVQHREVQGHESQLFKSYFSAIVLLKGGADTGFNRVVPEKYEPRLFHIQKLDTKQIVSKEIAYKRGEINENDVFIIDQGLKIYVYHGENCSHDEKFKGATFLNQLKSKRGGKCSVETSGGSGFLDLTGIPDGNDDDKDDDELTGEKEILKVSDADGSLRMEKLDGFSRDLLCSEDVFLINTGFEVFTWIGQGASIDERKNGLSYACNYLSKTSTPWLSITVVAEGKESSQFIEAF